MKSERYLAVNPMGKVPAIKHGGHVVTECAAICAYLADVFPQARLGPREQREGRLLPLAVLRRRADRGGGVEPGDGLDPDSGARTDVRLRQFRQGHRRPRRACSASRDYVCGDRFTAADVYVGSQIMFPMQFGMLPERDSFLRYRDRLQARDAYKRATEIDEKLIDEMGLRPPQPAQPQPA